ncbi:MAG TPA: sigma 54-interacting transcriptional regulator [Myxococcaceae bacterium]|nr:sigma 54-interacting transcriptional regulator [Myxococcaceae bacterium]
MTEKGDTLSLVEEGAPGQVRRGPHLFLELECERPLVGPARWRLTGFEQVRVGRGGARRSHVDPKVLSIEVPDAWMSVDHIEIRYIDGTWVARDLGAKNRLIVEGQPAAEATLSNEDLLQLGHTFFRFRSDVPALGPAILDFQAMPEGVSPLSTFSPLFGAVVERSAAIARGRVPVLLVGESGTGKEVLARSIHAQSGRKGGLVPVNCGAISPNLVESELFGHKKGAFSGALHDRPGAIRTSDGGTLFLDEIGDLPAAAQAAFLRVLQEAEVVPVGGSRPEPVDLRVVAATHHDLKRLVREGKFRHDLLARLDGVTLRLPALRDRSEDVPLLLVLLLKKLAPERPDVKFTPEAAQAILQHRWPLNIRELEQALAGALTLSAGGPIESRHLPETLLGTGEPEALPELTPEESRHRDELMQLIREHGGNLSAVARVLQKGRTQILRWVARYGIDVESMRS